MSMIQREIKATCPKTNHVSIETRNVNFNIPWQVCLTHWSPHTNESIGGKMRRLRLQFYCRAMPKLSDKSYALTANAGNVILPLYYLNGLESIMNYSISSTNLCYTHYLMIAYSLNSMKWRQKRTSNVSITMKVVEGLQFLSLYRTSEVFSFR